MLHICISMMSKQDTTAVGSGKLTPKFENSASMFPREKSKIKCGHKSYFVLMSLKPLISFRCRTHST